MAKLSATTTYVFAPPCTDGRQHLFGWLWWHASVTEDGTVERDMGWALTYRRARKATGLPVYWKARVSELVMSPGRNEMSRHAPASD
ncbi:hypothetical protein ACFYXH_40020 [Streptomyces sp. NPDC002730]|uniref:hypothetical protein n=1 Tax=Streptomyces sp. NPDC002730 TaxID=3364662 RepID=UPI0036AFEE01